MTSISSNRKRRSKKSAIVTPFSRMLNTRAVKKTKPRKLRNIGLSKIIVVDRDFYRPSVIPLVPLLSPYLENPVVKVPSFLCYNPMFMSIPEDQGQLCGSCWSFSIAYMLADRTMMYTDSKFKEKNLSAQQLLSCYDFPSGCDGAIPEDALDWMAKNKFLLTSNEKFDYQQEDTGTISQRCPIKERKGIGVVDGTVRSIVKFVEEEYNPIEKDKARQKQIDENVLNMKRELLLNGPFYCAMTVYRDLYSFVGGEVYKKSPDSPLDGGHAIEIVGYCDKGVDPRLGYKDAYWIIKNTWSTSWPRNGFLPGYFCIQMGVNMCGIESRCGSAVPNVKRVKRTKQVRFTNIRRFLDSLIIYSK